MRRILKGKIKWLSLCPRGANGIKTILKDDGAFELGLLSKGMDDNGELHAIVYAPELRDSQGDIASAEVIKDMLYSAARDGFRIDIRHNEQPVTKDRAFVAEQFLVQRGDPRFEGLSTYDGKPVDPAGSWGVVIKIEDSHLRKLYSEGEWDGISMGGTAQVKHEKQDDLADRIVDRLTKKLNQEDTVTPEQIQELAKATATAVVAAIKANEPKPAPQPKAPAEPQTSAAPVFKGDPTNLDDVRKHNLALKKHNLLRSVDWGDPAAVAKVEEELEALTKSGADDKSDDLKKAKAELAKAQERIKKLQGASRQPASGPQTPADGSQLVGVDKEAERCAAIGLRMAQWANSRRAS